jgi:proteasome lid subunit RPN8/RPN11|tara:strand:- start:19 stop:360 length:342 start_codon:yes stop_codon:yes gene_type:complete
MNESCKKQAIQHAKEEAPNECCGLFLKTEKGYEYFKCKNISHELETTSFIIDPLDFADGEDKGEVVGVVHSHPQNVLEFSEEDIVSCNSVEIPFYLVCPDLDKMIVIKPKEDA